MGKIRSLPVELSGPLKDVFPGQAGFMAIVQFVKTGFARAQSPDFTPSGYLMLRREAVLCNRYHKGNNEVYR